MSARSSHGEPLTRRELAAWRGMLRVSFRLRRDLGAQLTREHGLSTADYDVLVRLADDPARGMRMSDLADAVLQPRSSLTRIVSGLEARGLVRREPAPDDGRGARARLTRAGAAAFRRAQVTHLDGVRRVFLDRLTDAQLDQLAAAWAAIEE
jgi:DNA-binding MarR family transcriptional regulator